MSASAEKSYSDYRIEALQKELAAAQVDTKEGTPGARIIGMARVLFNRFLNEARCSVNHTGPLYDGAPSAQNNAALRTNLARVANFVEGADPKALDQLRHWFRENLGSLAPAIQKIETENSTAASKLRAFLGNELRQAWTMIPSEINHRGQIAVDWEYAATHGAPEGWEPPTQ